MIKKIKTPFIIILCIALVALIILWRLSAGNESAEEGHAIQYESVAETNEDFSLKMNTQSEDFSEDFKKNQAEATAITDRFYEYLRKTYGVAHDDCVYMVNGLSAESFPEYYSGAYINEDGKLIVQIAERYYSAKYKKSDWYHEFVEIVENENFYCHPVKYSYRELINAISDVTLGESAKQIKALGISTYIAVIDDCDNCVKVYFENQNDYDAVIDKLESDVYSVSTADIHMHED